MKANSQQRSYFGVILVVMGVVMLALSIAVFELFRQADASRLASALLLVVATGQIIAGALIVWRLARRKPAPELQGEEDAQGNHRR